MLCSLLRLMSDTLYCKLQTAITIRCNYLWLLIAQDSMSLSSKCIIHHLCVFFSWWTLVVFQMYNLVVFISQWSNKMRSKCWLEQTKKHCYWQAVTCAVMNILPSLSPRPTGSFNLWYSKGEATSRFIIPSVLFQIK